MKAAIRPVAKTAAAIVVFACLPGRAVAQELSAAAKEKNVAEARAKRNAQSFELNATTLVFLDSSGRRTKALGERALYDETVMSPDGSRVAVVTEDLANETADLFIVDVAYGTSTRLTTSARTEFVESPVWSPDGNRIAYVTIRKGQEGLYVRSADGKGPEELIYTHAGAFMNLTDWSSDGRFLTFAISDLSGGKLYTLPLDGTGDRKPIEIFHSDLRLLSPKFSPDGRFVSYAVIDKSNLGEIFVRAVDPAATGGPWKVSEGAASPGFWRRDGKAIYYVARDQAMMVADVSTSATFSSTKPRMLFRQASKVPDRVTYVSADGERFLALPPPRGPQLQQITIFNRQGEPVQKVGEPDLYNSPSFSPDGTRLLVSKFDSQVGHADIWTIDLASGKQTRLTNDPSPKSLPLWSPDGKYIYYTSFRGDEAPVFRRPSEPGGAEELVFRYTPGAGVSITDFTLDGKFLVGESGGVILLVPLNGDPAKRKAIEFLREEFTDGVGRLSPDGKFMAFRSDEAQPERGEVYVRSFNAAKGMPGKGKWRVSTDGVNAMIHWRQDGKEIFFRGQNLDSPDLLVMSADVTTSPRFTTSKPKLLFKLPGPLGGNLGNISRDGQRFVFAVNVPAATTP
jgi:Tol biopolymer transport system component